jgi:hypothetical protein
VLVWSCLSSLPAIASYKLPPWRTAAAASDLIGTVEVERAGLGVARVKVLESWKGPPAGSRFNLDSTLDPLRGNLQLLLVGERYLLFGSEVRPRQTVKPPLLSPGCAPQLGRSQAEYSAGFPWGCVPLIANAPLGGAFIPFAKGYGVGLPPKQALLRFLALSPAEQEKEMLQSFFAGSPAALANALRQAATVEDVLRIILRLGRDNPSANWAVACGGAETLRVLLKLPPAQLPFPPHVVRADIQRMCIRHPELATNLALRPKLSPSEESLRMTGMTGRLAQEKYPTNQAPQFRRLLDTLRKAAKTPTEMVNQLSEFTPNLDANAQEQLIHVIAAGGPETLRALEASPPERFGAGGAVWEDARGYLRLRLGLPPAPRVFAGVDDRRSGNWWFGTATEAQIAGWRKQLASRDESNGMAGAYFQNRAFERMTIHDPAGAVDWLFTVEPGFRFAQQGAPDISLLAVFFTDYCRTNRDDHLRRLLTARNPSVRAIAATALAVREPNVAMPVLRAMRDRTDGAGDLANLELARRGDKAAMDHLIEMLPAPLTTALAAHSSFAWPVAAEARALLSNSAQASGLPQPGDNSAAWWKENRAAIRLADPWLMESTP